MTAPLGSLFVRGTVSIETTCSELLQKLRLLGFEVQEVDGYVFAVGDGIYLRLSPVFNRYLYENVGNIKVYIDKRCKELIERALRLFKEEGSYVPLLELLRGLHSVGMCTASPRILDVLVDYYKVTDVQFECPDEFPDCILALRLERIYTKITFEGTLIAVVDVFDIETSRKVLRKLKDLENTLKIRILSIDRERSM